MTVALLIAPVWLIALWLVTGLCAAARVGDAQRCLVEDPRWVEDGGPAEDPQRDDALAQPEWAAEQWRPHAPAVVAGRKAA